MKVGQIREGLSEEKMTQLTPNGGVSQAAGTACAEVWGSGELTAAPAKTQASVAGVP